MAIHPGFKGVPLCRPSTRMPSLCNGLWSVGGHGIWILSKRQVFCSLDTGCRLSNCKIKIRFIGVKSKTCRILCYF